MSRKSKLRERCTKRRGSCSSEVHWLSRPKMKPCKCTNKEGKREGGKEGRREGGWQGGKERSAKISS